MKSNLSQPNIRFGIARYLEVAIQNDTGPDDGIRLLSLYIDYHGVYRTKADGPILAMNVCVSNY
jgi:hypothetical protein